MATGEVFIKNLLNNIKSSCETVGAPIKARSLELAAQRAEKVQKFVNMFTTVENNPAIAAFTKAGNRVIDLGKTCNNLLGDPANKLSANAKAGFDKWVKAGRPSSPAKAIPISGWRKYAHNIGEFFSKIWDWVYNTIFAPIARVFGDIWDKVSGVFRTIGDALYKYIGKPFIDHIYNPIKNALSSKIGDSSSTWGDALLTALVVFAAFAALFLIGKWLYAKYKNWQAKRSGRVRESYVDMLNRQSFIEAKQVARFLKENTAMSKYDCNKVANFVYKKSLNRKINNLI